MKEAEPLCVIDSKVSQSLFIGYLVSGVNAHDPDFYTTSAGAHFGIQFRAIVACLGVATLAMQGALEAQVFYFTLRLLVASVSSNSSACLRSIQSRRFRAIVRSMGVASARTNRWLGCF